MSRDVDRRKVYDAEALVWDETLYQEPLGLDGVTSLAADLFAHPWWASQIEKVPVIEPTRREANRSYARSSGLIRLSLYHENAAALAHEAAHVATRQVYGPEVQGHGPEYRLMYVEVTALLCGMAAAARLLTSFTDANLPLAPRRTDEVVQPAPYGIYGLWRLA